jgi:hypothetical protein
MADRSSILGWGKISLFSSVYTGSEAYPASYLMDTARDFSGGKAAGT